MINTAINSIKLLQVYSSLFILLDPIITNDNSAAISFSNYIRKFCLNMIVRTDKTNLSLRNFINNFKHIALPEMDENEYQYSINSYDANYYDEYVFSAQEIINKIIVYDVKHNTNIFNEFCDHLCLIATEFAVQNLEYKSSIDNFIKLFKVNMTNIANSKNVLYNKKVEQGINENITVNDINLINLNQKFNLNNFTNKKDIDIQFVIRIILPLIIMVGFIVGTIVTGDWLMILVSIIPLCFLVFGFKAHKKRCPHCGAWESMKVIKSKCVGSRKVKVRRGLGSGYFRTSGNNTYAIRQVFVKADEYTYNEIYRCTICGFEINSTRKVIDDGIR